MRTTFTMMIRWVLLWLVCGTRTTCDGRPRGGDPLDNKQRRELRDRLNGDRGGAAGKLSLKGTAKREILLSPAALPKPLSEPAATLHQGKIYISGGCDSSPHGKQWDPATEFYSGCSSVSNSFYSFDPSIHYGRGLYQSLANLPHPRYRHTSAALNGNIWLLGGRDVNDTLVDTVDVYDIDADSWTSLTIPELFQTSDHASFVFKKSIFIAGGYSQDYNEKSAVYRIDTETNTIEDVQRLTVARGDVVVTQTSDYAYVAGGYSTNNNERVACEPSNVVEQYEFATGMWTSLPALIQPRANGGMVHMNGILFVLGGEKGQGMISSPCPSTGDLNDDGSATTSLITLDTVEVSGTGGGMAWAELTSRLDTLRPHARFAAVATIQATESIIYTFGGQLPYSSSCECFPIADTVVAYYYRTLHDEANDLMVASISPTNSPTAYSQTSSSPLPTTIDDVDLTIGNNRCEDAVDLEVVPAGWNRFSPAFGTTVGASVDTNVPVCNGIQVDQPGVWFQVVGLTQGVMTAQTCGSFTNYDVQLSVYQDGVSNSCDNLVCVNANDDDSSCGTKARVSWNADRGQVYFLLVHGWVDDPVGNYQLSVLQEVREPPNDHCEHAQGPLSVGSSVDGATTFASLDDDVFGVTDVGVVREHLCGESSYGTVEGVWYYLFGTGSVLVADTCDDRTDYDTQLHVFTGDDCGSGLLLECIQGNDNSVDYCGSLTTRKSRVRWQSEFGVHYWIYVHGRRRRRSAAGVSSSSTTTSSSSSSSSKGYFVLTISEEE